MGSPCDQGCNLLVFFALNGLQRTFWQMGETSGPCDGWDIKKPDMQWPVTVAEPLVNKPPTIDSFLERTWQLILQRRWAWRWARRVLHVGCAESSFVCSHQVRIRRPLMAVMERFTTTIQVRRRALLHGGNKHQKNADWPLNLPCNRNWQTRLAVFINQRH